MGLNIEVGVFDDLKNADPEGFEDLFGCLKAASDFLVANGLPAHSEPPNLEPWGAQMYGYSGLHYLRRLAAHIDAGLDLPGPGDDKSSKDDVVHGYYASFNTGIKAVLSTLMPWRRKFRRSFDHLIYHSDAEGFYLPVDFPNVLIAIDDPKILGGIVGSVPRLLGECDRLAEILGIPEGLNAESDELWDAADSQGEGEETWQRYGIETYSCVVLREGCRKSMETGAALVFT